VVEIEAWYVRVLVLVHTRVLLVCVFLRGNWLFCAFWVHIELVMLFLQRVWLVMDLTLKVGKLPSNCHGLKGGARLLVPVNFNLSNLVSDNLDQILEETVTDIKWGARVIPGQPVSFLVDLFLGNYWWLLSDVVTKSQGRFVSLLHVFWYFYFLESNYKVV